MRALPHLCTAAWRPVAWRPVAALATLFLSVTAATTTPVAFDCGGGCLDRAAHSIKSNAHVFGAAGLADLAMKLELEGEGAVDVSELENTLSQTSDALRNYLNG